MAGRCLIFILLILSLSSCFEVIEEISFRKNGSGTYTFILNMSQSRNEINSLMKLDSSSGFRIPRENEINSYLDEGLLALGKVEGISNLAVKRDFHQWVFEIRLDFKNTKALDAGLATLKQQFSGGRQADFYSRILFTGRSFERDFRPDEKDVRNIMERPAGKKVFSSAKFTTIYRFEQPVVKVSHPKARISPSKKAVMLQGNILNLLNGTESVNNIIHFQ